MTGYGRGLFQDENYKIVVEVKTLNSRYLEMQVRVPEGLGEAEVEIRRQVKSQLARGRVDITCTVETNSAPNLNVDSAAVGRYLEIADYLRRQFKLAGELDLSTLIQLPGVITAKSEAIVPDPQLFKQHLALALSQALEAVNAMREQEGHAIREDIVERLRNIERSLSRIELQAHRLFEHYRQRLEQRLRELTVGVLPLDETRLAQEAALYADRSDISEEIVRMKSHIAQFYELLEADGEVGKRMDFMLQEMGREINTMLSKAAAVGVAEHGISIKAEIEKLREQAQNLE